MALRDLSSIRRYKSLIQQVGFDLCIDPAIIAGKFQIDKINQVLCLTYLFIYMDVAELTDA